MGREMTNMGRRNDKYGTFCHSKMTNMGRKMTNMGRRNDKYGTREMTNMGREI
jgi:hypothetical protein